MKFKKMFSIVLMTLLCFNMVNVKVFADDVNNENIASEASMKGTYTRKLGNAKRQSENNFTKEIKETFAELLAKKASAQSTKKASAVKATALSLREKKTYNPEALRLMATIIYCEAQGESYAGKLAVGIVVMNRKASREFPDSIKGVIYQKYQFQPTRNGSMKKALKLYDSGKFKSAAQKDCIKAAKEALDGERTVVYKSKTINMKSYHFFSMYLKGCRLKIGNHQFK